VAEAAASAARGARVALRPLLLGAIALAAVATGAAWLLGLRGVETTDDAFVEGHLVFLSPRVGGHVVEVAVDENQHVVAGQPLVRLDPTDFAVRVARARADLDAARNRLGQSRAAADAAAAQAEAAGVRLRHSERELARVQGLIAAGAASRTALDAATAARDAASAELDAARERERAERAALGNDAPVRQAEAALREAELALEHAVVTAPFAGTIGKRSVELGANVSPGQPLLALASDDEAWVTANFKETQIQAMRPGDPVEIHVDAFPDRAYRGRVESLAPATGAKYALLPPDNATGNFTKVVQRVPVRIALERDDEAPRLPVGLSVHVRVRVH
jgi:membrane fusion protein (multidrug efflux system)